MNNRDLVETESRVSKNHLGPKEYRIFLGQVLPLLGADFVRSVEAFEYGQWELHFEAVLWRLLEGNQAKQGIDINLVEKLAKQAGLEEEGVLAPDTWQRFMSWYQVS